MKRAGAGGRSEALEGPLPRFIDVDEFAHIAKLSRSQINRLRVSRPSGFPTEYDLGSTTSKYRRCPRFKLSEVLVWMDSRALW